MTTEQKVIREFHSIKPFRGEGGLGIIRLNHLAIPGTAKIHFNEMEFKAIGFDTYGHPIISNGVFSYYKALKLLAERNGESLVPIVEYMKRPFCISKKYYDSREEIEKIVEYDEILEKTEKGKRKKLEMFKQMLINRKLAAFQGTNLSLFVVYGIYVLAPNGHVYYVDSIIKKTANETKYVLEENDILNITFSKEVHLPDSTDACNICGSNFTMDDIVNGIVAEDLDCNKVHKHCLNEFQIAIEHKKASSIVDAVYDEHPKSYVQKEENPLQYVFETKQGKIYISFIDNDRVKIKWSEEFFPFDLKQFGYPETANKTHTAIAKTRDHAIDLLIGVKNS